MRAGLLPDLYVGDNIFKARPFEYCAWTYTKTFVAPEEFRGKRVELVFHGTDCIATYVLNGILIGSSENMFVEHAFDVGDVLRYGEPNFVAVKIESAVNHARRFPYDPSVWSIVAPE